MVTRKEFLERLRRTNKKNLKKELDVTSKKSDRERKEPKHKRDFGLLLALENKEHLLRNEIRNKEKEESDKMLRKKLK